MRMNTKLNKKPELPLCRVRFTQLCCWQSANGRNCKCPHGCPEQIKTHC